MSGWVRSPRRKVKTGTDSNPPLGAGDADTIPDNGAEGARATLSTATAAAINVHVNHLLVKEDFEGLRNPRYISIIMPRSSFQDS